MNEYWTIFETVAGAIFGPGLVMVATAAVIVVAFFWALFSGSREASFPWWAIVASWVAFAVVLVPGAALMGFLLQFHPFAWELAS